MNEFIEATYGDPCRRCGYNWALGPASCKEIITSAATQFASLMAGQDGKMEHVELEWNAVAYVIHVADVLRIWADRVAAAALGNSDLVVPYDEGELGLVRGYCELPLAGALWALGRAVGDWLAAEELTKSAGCTLNHPEQGSLSLDNARRIIAHEIEHHAVDLLLIMS